MWLSWAPLHMTVGPLNILFCGYKYSKDPLLLGDRPLCSLKGVSWWEEILNLNAAPFIRGFFNVTAFGVLSGTRLFWGREGSHLGFLLKAVLFPLLHLDLRPTSNWLSCVVCLRVQCFNFTFPPRGSLAPAPFMGRTRLWVHSPFSPALCLRLLLTRGDCMNMNQLSSAFIPVLL